MKRLSHTLILLMSAGAMALAGCSKHHSSAPPAGTESDLPGFWTLWTNQSGQGEVGPAVLFLALTGSTIVGPDLSGTASGSTFQFTADVMGGIATAKGTLTTSSIGTGTYTIVQTGSPSIIGTFRMAKFSPTGFVAVNGSILGMSITHQSNQAVGVRKYLDAALTNLIEAEVSTGSADMTFELDIEPRNLTLGNLTTGMNASDVGIAVEFSTPALSARAVAIGGTIIVTKYDAGGFAATFTLNLDTGDTVNGVIDVQFDIEALYPFGA